MGCVRDALAGGLRSRRTRTVGVLAERVLSTPCAVAMIDAVLTAGRAHGWSVLLTDAGPRRGAGPARAILVNQKVKGVTEARSRSSSSPPSCSSHSSSAGSPGRGHAVAGDLLRAGHRVLVGCVNPVETTREAWRDAAQRAGAGLLEVELVCGDPLVHRARAEGRVVDVPGLDLPDWHAIRSREYRPWPSADLRVDTATASAPEAAAMIRSALGDDGAPSKPARPHRTGPGVVTPTSDRALRSP